MLDMVLPDGLFKGIPLGLGRGMDGSNPVASKRTGAGHPMKAIAGVKVRANQVAQQVHFHPSGNREKYSKIWSLIEFIQVVFPQSLPQIVRAGNLINMRLSDPVKHFRIIRSLRYRRLLQFCPIPGPSLLDDESPVKTALTRFGTTLICGIDIACLSWLYTPTKAYKESVAMHHKPVTIMDPRLFGLARPVPSARSCRRRTLSALPGHRSKCNVLDEYLYPLFNHPGRRPRQRPSGYRLRGDRP